MRIKLSMKNVVLGFIFLYPISPWYITIGPVNLVNIISMVFIGFWILMRKKVVLGFKNTSKLFWLYLIIYSIQAFCDTSFMKAFAYLSAQLIVCYILYIELVRRDILEEAIDIIIYACGFLCILGIFEELTRTNIFHLISGLPSDYFYTEIRLGIYRIETSFSHPIVYCSYLCFVQGLVAYRLNNNINTNKRKKLKIIYILILINAIFTVSRSTLIILFIEQIIIGYKTGFLKMSKKMIIIFYFGVIIFLISLILKMPIIDKLKDIGFMFLSLFNKTYSDMYSTAFGVNSNAVGNRLDLYYWVIDAVKGNELLGMGTSADFAHSVNAIESTWNTNYTWIKRSIENEYLFNYYIHGIIGLITFILNMIGSIIYLNKVNIRRKKIGKSIMLNENKLTLSNVVFIIIIGYAVTLFSVRQSDTVRLFNVIMCIMFSYNINLKSRIKL